MLCITINNVKGKNYDTLIEILVKNERSKIYPINCNTIKSTLDHEIGHQLDDLLSIRNIPEIQNIFTSRSEEQLTE